MMTASKPSPTRQKRQPRATKERPLSELDAESAVADGDADFMTSLARGLAVIRGFSEQGAPLSIAELSRKVALPRAAVRRCLHTLERLGFVGSEGRGFYLKPKILTLGYAYLSSNTLSSAAQPILDRTAVMLEESCSLATLSGSEIIYVGRARTSKRIMSIDISIGTRLPAHCTSMGRVLLAHLSPKELQSFLGRAKLPAFTPRTVVAHEKLRQILDGVRRTGYSLVDQELEMGLRSIAVPVFDSSGQVAAAINVGTQAARVGIREMESRVLPVLREAATTLGTLLRR
jgi:IclR family pca regulon transcriptional regulator